MYKFLLFYASRKFNNSKFRLAENAFKKSFPILYIYILKYFGLWVPKLRLLIREINSWDVGPKDKIRLDNIDEIRIKKRMIYWQSTNRVRSFSFSRVLFLYQTLYNILPRLAIFRSVDGNFLFNWRLFNRSSNQLITVKNIILIEYFKYYITYYLNYYFKI